MIIPNEIIFDPVKFEAVRPTTLREFCEKVLGRPLPPMRIVGDWYEALGLGPKLWYIGTAEQNMHMLIELKYRAKQ